LKSSKALDDILSHQRSPLNKYGLGYVVESSGKSDANPNASKDKNVEKLESCANIPNSNKSKEKNQNNIGGSFASRRHDASNK